MTNSSLFKHKPFLWSLGLPLVTGMIVAAAIAIQSDFYFTWIWNSNTISNFIDAIKIPGSIAMLAIPIGTLVALNFRTEQQGQQNRYSNYYEHVREFEAHISSLPEFREHLCNIVTPRSLHRKFFPRDNEYNFKFSVDIYNEVKEKFDSITINIDSQNQLKNGAWWSELVAFFDYLNSINMLPNGYGGQAMYETLWQAEKAIEILKQVFEFDGDATLEISPKTFGIISTLIHGFGGTDDPLSTCSRKYQLYVESINQRSMVSADPEHE